MPDDIFGHLEPGSPLPAEVKAAVSRINAFEHLEIGEIKCAPSPVAPPRDAMGVLCPHCHQPNERERDTCWACYKPLRKSEPKPGQGLEELTLVIDGMPYKSTDPDLPPDIAELMSRIRAQGYSQQLLADWQNWRATRNVRKQEEDSAPEEDVKVFQGQRVSVIRLDGKVYLSDDPNLTPELRQLFDYLAQYGPTPALMEQLRRYGKKVKYRPSNTGVPSDGDVDFWKDVKSSL